MLEGRQRARPHVHRRPAREYGIGRVQKRFHVALLEPLHRPVQRDRVLDGERPDSGAAERAEVATDAERRADIGREGAPLDALPTLHHDV